MLKQLEPLRVMESRFGLPPSGTYVLVPEGRAITWETAAVDDTLHMSFKLFTIDRRGELQLLRHRCLVFQGVIHEMP